MIDFLYTVNGKTKRFGPIAENYNELSRRQLLQLARLFASGMEADVARLHALKILLGYGWLKFLRIHASWKERMLPAIDWVFERNGLTSQLLPMYRRNWFSRRFYGPAAEWDNMTMKEWNACEIYYYQAVAGDDDSAIDNLIAVLYRPGKRGYDTRRDPDGDLRQPFNPNVSAYYASKVRRWPVGVKVAIMTWYDGCREYMKQTYDVFENSPTKGQPKDPGMFHVIRSLTGERYGLFEMVENMNVHLGMREMELLKKEAKAQEARLKQKK